MEYFDWISVVQMISMMFQPTITDTNNYAAIYGEQVWTAYMIAIPVAAGLFVALLILGGLGLKKLAQKEGLRHSWLGFLPFTNTYYAGKVAGETKFFSQKIKRIGLYAMLIEIVCVILQAVVMFCEIYATSYLTATLNENNRYDLFVVVGQMPSNIAWLYSDTWQMVLTGFSYLFSLVRIIFLCVLFSALFRKYYAKSPFVMTILCILTPFTGVVLFAVRNNSPFDYEAYYRQRQQAYMNAQRQQYQGYQNPYGGYQNPYGNQRPTGGTGANVDPFSDFAGENKGESGEENPFDEF